MKWVTRRGLHVDRTACAWLIKNHIDPEAEFVFVPAGSQFESIEGKTFDMSGADYTHSEGKCSFEALLERHGLSVDAALAEMGKIIRQADVPPRRAQVKEAGGFDAIMRGFQMGVLDDHEKLRLTGPVYDALYVYCREKVAGQKPHSQAIPRPRLRYSRRFVEHLAETENSSDESH